MAASINFKTRARSGSTGPRAVLADGLGNVLTLPFAPTGFDADGWARKWATLTRYGNKDVDVDTGPGLRGVAYPPITVARKDGSSISGILRDLMQIADAGGVIKITGLSSFESGPWRIAEVSVSVTHRTSDNEPRIAEVQFKLREATFFTARIARSKQTAGKGKTGKRK